MAKLPIPGTCKTRLAKKIGNALATDFARALLLDTVDFLVAQNIDYQVDLFCPQESQVPIPDLLANRTRLHRESDLGRRLQWILSSQRGDRPLIFIGTDSPAAIFHHLSQASKILTEQRRPVLGPSHDGGVYLIGIPPMWQEPFHNIIWGEKDVYARLMQNAEGLHPHSLTFELDLDEKEDLSRALEDPLYERYRSRLPRTLSHLRSCLKEPSH